MPLNRPLLRASNCLVYKQITSNVQLYYAQGVPVAAGSVHLVAVMTASTHGSAQSCKQSSSHFTQFSRHGDLCPLMHDTHHPLSYLAATHLAHQCVSYGHCNA